VQASALLDPGRPVLLHLHGDGGDVVFACIVRDVDGGKTDVTTPYGYGGPVAAGPEPPLERFWQEYKRWCADGGVVTTFLRFHPLYANHRGVASYVHVERLAGTIAWRLDQADLFEGMHRHHRRIVRKAQAAGVEGSLVTAPGSLERFVRLYEQTMERKDASGFYYFPREYWRALEAGLRERIVLFEVGEDAALLCLAARPWLHYHLGATSEEGRKLGASNLLFLEAAQWAAAEEFTRFHLGGGIGGGADSLFEFKRRFDPAGAVEMAVGKAVHDEAAYGALTGGDSGTSGFFPAYRRAASTVNA
jgi:serine/alanine adding enzyme